MDKAILTCSINGVLTNPKQHPVPVTPQEMAESARDAYNAGASIMHIHFRAQEENMGHLPTWDPEVAFAASEAIRELCPGAIINQTTGVFGDDISGPVGCLKKLRPEIAACNAGSLNYLKLKKDNTWAWPPQVFPNSVEKVQAMVDAMKETNTVPEMECFDVGIVRSVNMYQRMGMAEEMHFNFVMGVASGMPCDPALLELLLKYKEGDAFWQTTLIGRQEIWATHQRTAELGGMLRTGVEDTFYLPNGERTSGNGQLIEALAICARNAGREVASPEEARQILGLN